MYEVWAPAVVSDFAPDACAAAREHAVGAQKRGQRCEHVALVGEDIVVGARTKVQAFARRSALFVELLRRLVGNERVVHPVDEERRAGDVGHLREAVPLFAHEKRSLDYVAHHGLDASVRALQHQPAQRAPVAPERRRDLGAGACAQRAPKQDHVCERKLHGFFDIFKHGHQVGVHLRLVRAALVQAVADELYREHVDMQLLREQTHFVKNAPEVTRIPVRIHQDVPRQRAVHKRARNRFVPAMHVRRVVNAAKRDALAASRDGMERK